MLLVVAQVACSKVNGGLNANDAAISQLNERCDTLVSGTEGSNLSQPAAARLVSELQEVCAPGLKRDMAIAETYLGANQADKAKEALSKMVSTDPAYEPKRIFYLYGLEKDRDDHLAMSELANQAYSQFPDSPYSRLMRGIVMCQHSDCRSAIADLVYSDQALHSKLGMGYLMAAYADSSDFSSALKCLETFRSSVPVAGFDDLLMYVAVFTYLKAGKADDAQRLFDDFLQAYPETDNSKYVRRARDLLDRGKATAA